MTWETFREKNENEYQDNNKKDESIHRVNDRLLLSQKTEASPALWSLEQRIFAVETFSKGKESI